jgi:hypothetical protein
VGAIALQESIRFNAGQRMKPETWILAASLILNAVLVIALFFKSALNEMLSHWFKERLVRRERRRQLLLELHGRMASYDRNYILWLIGVLWDRSTPELHAQVETELTETNNFIDRHEAEFPRTVRALLPQFHEAKQVRDYPDVGKAEMKDICEKLEEVTTTIRQEIERLLR